MQPNGLPIRLALALAISAVALSEGVFAAEVSTPPQNGGYGVTKTIPLGAVTKWDYAAVDSAHHHLFLSRGEYSEVLDSVTGEKVGEIRPTSGVHGFAFAPELNLGFISAGKADSVVVIDLTTLAIKKTIPSGGSNPDSIVYDPASQKVFVMNGHSKSISVIDAKSLTVTSTLATSGKPEFGVTDAAGHVFVNLEEKAGAIQVVDTASEKTTATWMMEGCAGPSGLAIDTAHHRLFSACSNGVMAVTDSQSGKAVTRIAIGEDPDAAFFDPDSQNAFSSNGGSGTLTIAHEDSPDRFTVLAQLPTEKRARTMAFDAQSKQLFLPTVVNDQFSLVVVGQK